jgi:hypothetical protein
MNGRRKTNTMRARAIRLGTAILVLLAAIGTVGCGSSGADSGATDPLADVGLIEMPTLSSFSGSAAITASSVGAVHTIDRLISYVNEYNDTQTILAPNGFLTAIKERAASGQDMTQPFTMEFSFGPSNSASMEATFRRIDSGSTTRFIGWYDQTPHPATFDDPDTRLEDAPFELVFTENYGKVAAIAGIGPDGILMVEFDYRTGNGFYVDNGEDQGLNRNGFYRFESFESANGTYTYRAIETNHDGSESDKVVAHVVSGNGLGHFLDDKNGTSGDNADSVKAYSGTDGSGDASDETQLSDALDSINSRAALPEEILAARQNIIPDFTASEYTDLLATHRANF